MDMDAFRITLFFFPYFMVIVSGQDVTVVTNIGTIIGEIHRSSFNTTPVVTTRFLGIPFAEPPIGDRRFRRPVKKAAFTSSFTAQTMSPQCHQNSIDRSTSVIVQSEDCLYLNILVPGTGIDTTKLKTVMIWIYGGGFQQGSQDPYTSSNFAALNDVILVTLNYRVSVFGFLSTGENLISGNYGLWDQHMAIQWVHDHIANFGGDPNKVTIFGESAGAACVTYQALYKGSQGLFQRVIAQSGSANLGWAINEYPRTAFDQFVNRSDCIVGTLHSVIKCLRNKTAAELKSAVINTEFNPVFDGEFIKLRAADIFKNETEEAAGILTLFGNLDFIFGVSSDEGGYFIPFVEALLPPSGTMDPYGGYSIESFENILVPFIIRSDISSILVKAIKHKYINWKNISNTKLIRQGAIDLLSDMIVPGVITATNAHANTGEDGRTFFYVYDHQASFLPSDRGYSGAAHAEDLPIVFGLSNDIVALVAPEGVAVPDDPASMLATRQDVLLSRQVMEYWTNFAKTG